MPKQNAEYDAFNAAMDTILKTDPVKVKAEMEEDKREREERRKVKREQQGTEEATGGMAR